MKRRNFLKNTSAGFIAPAIIGNYGVRINPLGSFNQYLTNDSDKVLVIIQLVGGNDGLNTLVPYDKWAELNNARPEIMLAENDLLDLSGTDIWKLHPNMTGMRDLYNEGKIRAIQSVGYPFSSHSHALDTDRWMNGVQYNAPEYFTGWAGRFLQQEYPGYPDPALLPDHPPAIEIGDSQSLVFMGQTATMGVLMPGPHDFRDWYWDMGDGVLDGTYGSLTNVGNLPDGYNQGYCHAMPRLDYLRETNGIIQNFIPHIIDAYNNVNGNTPSNYNTFSNKLSIIANLIAGGLQTKIYLVRQGDYDTHGNQLLSHAGALNELSTSIRSFMDELTALGAANRVLGMTVSEFGRTTSSNGGGTDHGGPSSMFLFGNAVTGGVLGDSPFIPSEFNTGADDDLDQQFDLRDVYNTVLKNWFCVDQAVIDEHILYGSFNELDIIANPVCSSCTPELVVGGIVSEGTYQAGNSVSSDGVITTDTVEFKAGQEINLESGFTVESGSSFSAEIEDCSPDN